jgi:predicted ribosome quality control (RQC) complex YloA/Tae2 family protein
MYRNYFYLFRAILELSELIQGKKIVEAFTQEKDKLFLRVPIKDNLDFHLVISVNPQQSYINYKDVYHKAKKNTINFFNDWLPSTITNIEIALKDRVIKIRLTDSALIIFFRGGLSNVFLIDSHNELHSFKKIDKEDRDKIAEEINSMTFTNSASTIFDFLKNINDVSELKSMPSIGKDILREVEARGKSFNNDLLDVVNEILVSKISVFFNEGLNKPGFYPQSFRSVKLPEERNEFDEYFSALNKYFSISYSRIKGRDIKKEIEKHLTSELEKLSSKLNRLKIRIDSGTKEIIYHKYGDLLLANINSLKKGMKEITLSDYNTNELNKIQLDEKLSPHLNIQRYYEKARSEKIEFDKSKKLFEISSKEFSRLASIRDKFEKTDDNEQFYQIKKELKMKTQQVATGEKQETFSFRHYLIENKYHVYVGKDSKNNDQLTVRFAKQNDFWFHARSVSGSHVVLRVENTKEAVPKNVLKKTASLAAFYSKAKTSGLVPVTYTFKKYVVKNKSHEPGQVTVTKENVFLVKPEIPSNCEVVID